MALNTKINNLINLINKIISSNESITTLEKSIENLAPAESIDLEELYEDAHKCFNIKSILSKYKRFNEYETAASKLVVDLEKTNEIII